MSEYSQENPFVLDIYYTNLWGPQPDLTYGMHSVLFREVSDWCDRNLEAWKFGEFEKTMDTRMYFVSENDAMMFKIRWYGVDSKEL